jgi:hypothetical protein
MRDRNEVILFCRIRIIEPARIIDVYVTSSPPTNLALKWEALFRDREFLVSYLGPETDILNQVLIPAKQISGW